MNHIELVNVSQRNEQVPQIVAYLWEIQASVNVVKAIVGHIGHDKGHVVVISNAAINSDYIFHSTNAIHALQLSKNPLRMICGIMMFDGESPPLGFHETPFPLQGSQENCAEGSTADATVHIEDFVDFRNALLQFF